MVDDWTNTFNGYFWLTLAGLIIGGFHLALRYCERSKCRHCKLCGCIDVERNIEDTQQLSRAQSII